MDVVGAAALGAVMGVVKTKLTFVASKAAVLRMVRLSGVPVGTWASERASSRSSRPERCLRSKAPFVEVPPRDLSEGERLYNLGAVVTRASVCRMRDACSLRSTFAQHTFPSSDASMVQRSQPT